MKIFERVNWEAEDGARIKEVNQFFTIAFSDPQVKNQIDDLQELELATRFPNDASLAFEFLKSMWSMINDTVGHFKAEADFKPKFIYAYDPADTYVLDTIAIMLCAYFAVKFENNEDLLYDALKTFLEKPMNHNYLTDAEKEELHDKYKSYKAIVQDVLRDNPNLSGTASIKAALVVALNNAIAK